MTTHREDPASYIPLADAMRTTVLMHDPKYGAVGAGDLKGQELADHLLSNIAGWVGWLEQQIGQGEQHAALQLAFDLARMNDDPTEPILTAAKFCGVHLDPQSSTVDKFGMPTDDGWRQRNPDYPN